MVPGLITGLCFTNQQAFKENLGLQLEYRISSVQCSSGVEPGSSNTRCIKFLRAWLILTCRRKLTFSQWRF